MSEQQTSHPGYWKDASGSLIPVSKIKEIDKVRHKTVGDICRQAEQESARLMAFKTVSMQAVTDFINTSMAEYGIKPRGTKGNVTLFTFDGEYKIVRQMAETLVFDERLMAAKALIDDCITGWSKGSNDNIKVMVNHAFQVDQQGKISTGRVLGLRSLKITDPNWLLAMQAISDSMRVGSTKPYIRFYKRDAASGDYLPISLDVAAI
ncbi:MULTISPECIES: DUF3164 family protein [unclassified Polaromonas]|jgi:hypothetical protein|uniref:DUF3164 family protein n=1 Tax=unclassified Polaromonas TaxID=2638319 RepID=UPI000BCC709B|nr:MULTISPECIES: DUF3164 family protein [unclassified Polaromonas]OYY37071.1 MAG: sulfate transporter [Polaromonas sp. 35-63-35]OYZ13596.1 MAG: sulfate transporter [Polaromonas sp. 16-63-31]OYZ78827.1 MAG: sulfate transporter [Polaromonas sp. 24-63-21]OZA49659.1 MAG: sulfate transporter [Polaromonas sp. 17-63-33]OZA86797.1 MAG: sulfate transporter [Polaromonas sp. 39-63-25]